MQLCGSLSILWHCLSLGLEWKLTFSSPVAAAVFQICPIECSTLASVHGILQARILQWVAISYSRGPCQPVKWMQLYGNLNILWHCSSLELERKLTLSSPMATAEFSKFADILSTALSQHHLSHTQAHSYFTVECTFVFKLGCAQHSRKPSDWKDINLVRKESNTTEHRHSEESNLFPLCIASC